MNENQDLLIESIRNRIARELGGKNVPIKRTVAKWLTDCGQQGIERHIQEHISYWLTEKNKTTSSSDGIDALLKAIDKTEINAKTQQNDQPVKNKTTHDFSIQKPFVSNKTVDELLEEGYVGIDYENVKNTAFAAAADKFKVKIKWTKPRTNKDGETYIMTPDTEAFDQLCDFMLDKFGWYPAFSSSNHEEKEIFTFTPQNEVEEAAIEIVTSGERGWKGSLYSLEHFEHNQDDLCLIFATKPINSKEQDWLLYSINFKDKTGGWSVHNQTFKKVYQIWAEQIKLPKPNFNPS